MGEWSFGYDTLNRLISGAAVAGPYASQNLCWAYDAFGNRTMQLLQSAACPAPPTPGQPPTTAHYNANNQVTWTSVNAAVSGFSYDNAGEVLNDNANQYLYDAEGRICAVRNLTVGVMTGYIYDAGGTHVAKGHITAMSCNPAASGFTPTSDYILGPSGEQAAEMSVSSGGVATWQHTNVYAGGALLATYDASGPHYYLNDPLGTRRVQTNYAGSVEQTCASLPYGDGSTCIPNPPTEHLFTGKERDAESGNDYFGARYYSSAMGRFMSPDWSAKVEPVPYAKLDDPQSLNLYAYVMNNPMTRIDLDGHCGGDLWAYAACMIHNMVGEQPSKQPVAQAQAQQQKTGPPATPNPNGSVPAPAPGKGPNWKPGDPLTPNEWVPGKGTGGPDGRPTRWDPKYPIPGQSQPNTSWDAPNGHWDNPDGKGNTTRWLPGGGGPVDHDNNPTMMDRMRSITPGPILKWGTAGVVIYIIIDEGSRLYPPRNLVPVP
jgi:RHS repeat-associated protein